MKYLFLLAAFLCSLAFLLASYLLDILESSIIILINREDFRTLFVCSVLHYLYNFSFYTLTKFPVFFYVCFTLKTSKPQVTFHRSSVP